MTSCGLGGVAGHHPALGLRERGGGAIASWCARSAVQTTSDVGIEQLHQVG